MVMNDGILDRMPPLAAGQLTPTPSATLPLSCVHLKCGPRRETECELRKGSAVFVMKRWITKGTKLKGSDPMQFLCEKELLCKVFNFRQELMHVSR